MSACRLDEVDDVAADVPGDVDDASRSIMSRTSSASVTTSMSGRVERTPCVARCRPRPPSRRIADHQAHHEPVELGLRQRVGALVPIGFCVAMTMNGTPSR